MSFLSVFLHKTFNIPEEHLTEGNIVGIIGAAGAAAATASETGGNIVSSAIVAAINNAGSGSPATPPASPQPTVPVAEPSTIATWLENEAVKFTGPELQTLSNTISAKIGVSATTVDSVLVGGETDILNFVLSHLPSLPTTTAPPTQPTPSP